MRELVQEAETNASLRRTSMPVMVKTWLAAGTGMAPPVGVTSPKVPHCWTAVFVVVYA